jgi:hypothetical protein
MPSSSLFGFMVVALAVWRVTHLRFAEDGPWRVLARLRAATQGGFWVDVFGCFYCLSLWVAAPFAFALSLDGWTWRAVSWLALSGAACLLERLGQPSAAPAIFYEGDKEESHELLRRSTPRDNPSGDT